MMAGKEVNMFKEFDYSYYRREAEVDKKYEAEAKSKGLVPEGCNISFGSCDRDKRDQFMEDLEYFFGK
jgi:hypothetical protein